VQFTLRLFKHELGSAEVILDHLHGLGHGQPLAAQGRSGAFRICDLGQQLLPSSVGLGQLRGRGGSREARKSASETVQRLTSACFQQQGETWHPASNARHLLQPWPELPLWHHWVVTAAYGKFPNMHANGPGETPAAVRTHV
jgi:hypothetical protein